MMGNVRNLLSILTRVVAPIALFFLWEFSARFHFIDEGRFSCPSKVFLKFFELLLNGQLLANAGHSLVLVCAALGLSCLIGAPLGVAMGASRFLERLLYSLVELLRPIPPLAVLPLAILWLGIGMSEKVFLLVLGAVPPIVLNTFHAVRATEPVFIRAAKSMGASNWQVLRTVMVPSAAPGMFVGIRIASGFSFTVIVAAELVATESGLGHLLTIGWRTYDLETIFSAIFAIGLLSFGMDALLKFIQRRLIVWRSDDDILGTP